jgi:hypothetical protein
MYLRNIGIHLLQYITEDINIPEDGCSILLRNMYIHLLYVTEDGENKFIRKLQDGASMFYRIIDTHIADFNIPKDGGSMYIRNIGIHLL